MRCIPEWRLGAYVDGEASTEDARKIETHLVGCEDCRRSVMALREEATVLSQALRSHSLGAESEGSSEAPARGVLTGLPVGIAGGVGIATAISILVDTRVSAGLDWLHPARLLGVSDMFWNVIFLLRDDAPGLLEFAVALAALASVAAIGTFVAGALSRRITGAALVMTFGAALVVPALVASDASAAPELRHDAKLIHIRADQVVDGTFLASGESVIIEGRVVGDALIWAKQIEITGVIEGNLIAGGDDVDVSGEVQGTVAIGGDEVHFEGVAPATVFLAGGSITVGSKATIGRDLFLAADRIKFSGTAIRDAVVGGRHVDLIGRIGRDLTVSGESIDLTGSVGRNLEGHVRSEEDLRIDAAATIVGTTTVETNPEMEHSRFHEYTQGHFWLWRVVWLAGAFAVGVLLYIIVPGLYRVRVETGGEFGMALGIGVLSVPLVLLAVVLLAVTLVGLPLAILSLILYAIACYVAFLLLASIVGRHLTRPASDSLRDFGLALLVGLVAVTVLVQLPYVGGPARWVLMLSGIGLLVLRAREAWQERGAPGY